MTMWLVSIAIQLAMAIRNLSSNRYFWNDLDQVLFATIAIFLESQMLIAQVDQ